jgi:hypothetical protein
MSGGDLKTSLRHLIAEHGYASVNEAVNTIMAEDYRYLKSLFDKKSSAAAPAAAPATAPAPAVVQALNAPAPAPSTENVVVPSAEQSSAKVVRIKAKKGSAEVATPAPAPAPQPAPSPDAPVEDVKNIHIEQKEYRDPKEVKKWQKAQEEKKHAELLAAGVRLETVLTKENLKQWIEVEGQTFAWVAREKAGVPDHQVAATAKALGIQSAKSKQRIQIVASKRG